MSSPLIPTASEPKKVKLITPSSLAITEETLAKFEKLQYTPSFLIEEAEDEKENVNSSNQTDDLNSDYFETYQITDINVQSDLTMDWESVPSLLKPITIPPPFSTSKMTRFFHQRYISSLTFQNPVKIAAEDVEAKNWLCRMVKEHKYQRAFLVQRYGLKRNTFFKWLQRYDEHGGILYSQKPFKITQAKVDEIRLSIRKQREVQDYLTTKDINTMINAAVHKAWDDKNTYKVENGLLKQEDTEPAFLQLYRGSSLSRTRKRLQLNKEYVQELRQLKSARKIIEQEEKRLQKKREREERTDEQKRIDKEEAAKRRKENRERRKKRIDKEEAAKRRKENRERRKKELEEAKAIMAQREAETIDMNPITERELDMTYQGRLGITYKSFDMPGKLN